MKYNKIYFMHIHKTGGRHIIATVRDAMLETLNENDIKIIKRPNTHGGWHSEVDEQTYVFTVLRDPVEQAVSLYAHQISLNKMGDIKDEYDKSKLTKEHFFSWLQEKDLYPNFQAKHFLGDELYFVRDHPQNMFHVQLNFDEKLLEARKNKVNLFLNNNNIDGRSMEIQEKIFSDLGIKGTAKALESKKPSVNPESKILYDTLTEEERDFVRNYSPIDDYLYKNVVYF